MRAKMSQGENSSMGTYGRGRGGKEHSPASAPGRRLGCVGKKRERALSLSFFFFKPPKRINHMLFVRLRRTTYTPHLSATSMPTSTAASQGASSGLAGSPSAACSGAPLGTATHVAPAARARAAVPVLARAPLDGGFGVAAEEEEEASAEEEDDPPPLPPNPPPVQL